MHQDATWYGARPQPRGLRVRWGPSSPPPKRGRSPLPNFRPMSIVANGWMDQDGTWPGGGPWSKPHCARWGPSSPLPKRGQSQTARCIKMSFGIEVGLSPGDFLLDVDPASAPLKGHSSQFLDNVRCGQTIGWTKMALSMEVGLGPGDLVFDGDSASPPLTEGTPTTSQFLAHVYVAKRLDG